MPTFSLGSIDAEDYGTGNHVEKDAVGFVNHGDDEADCLGSMMLDLNLKLD